MAATRAFAFLQSEDPKRKFQIVQKGRHLRVLTVARAKVDLLYDVKLNLKALDDNKGITEDTLDTIDVEHVHNRIEI